MRGRGLEAWPPPLRRGEGAQLGGELHWNLGTDEAEVAASLGEETAQVSQQRAVKIGFRVLPREREKLKAVRVLELVERSRMDLSHRR